MAANISKKEIVVTGDVALDWQILDLSGYPKTTPGSETIPARICWQYGGALLMADLLSELIKYHITDSTNWVMDRISIPEGTICPDDERFVNTYASWALFPKTDSPEDKKKPVIWRVKDFQGISKAIQGPAIGAAGEPSSPEIIVVDEANLGFRNDRSRWPLAITHPKPGKKPWIVIKISAPLAQGELWEELYKNWADRLIVVLNVNDLRQTEVQISSELSWERTAQDVAWELVYSPHVNSISRCAHVIVSFNAAGAVWMKNPNPGMKAPITGTVPPECTLIFDPLVIEGMWEQNHPGKMVGNSACLTTGIVRELMIHPELPDMALAVKAGVNALRLLHEQGFEYQSNGSNRAQIAFPYKKLAQSFENYDGKTLGLTPIQFPTRLLDPGSVSDKDKPLIPGNWTILQQQQTSADEIEKLAFQILMEGAEAVLKNIPMGKFGNLLTVDRREIESFRGIRRLVNNYCTQSVFPRPLSIAVFGPPGSGKSFGIAQVAKSLRPDEIEKITFNLSQFGSTEELGAAFHKVRDLNLSGKTPLVFWDEFDSILAGAKFGWLRHFLVPMQDGEFMDERGSMHPIGKAIFVFAGGICSTMEDFVHEAEGNKDAKAPDFISRLRGFVNIMGSNPPEYLQDNLVSDPFYLIRRAILLRSILWQNVPGIFENRNLKGKLLIDNSVLRALLKTRLYKHGARSMESIIGMSSLQGKSFFDQSSLPSEAQLDLHVDGQDFLSLLQEISLDGETLERLAAANHEIFCEERKKEGYVLGLERNRERKTHPLLRPWDELPESYKESNRNAVRSIA
jgi:hypothetical protein